MNFSFRIISIISIFLFSLVTNQLGAQQVTAIEYFIDVDPGVGEATQVIFDVNSDVLVNFDVDLSSLDNGIHRLIVRAKDEKGRWSIIQSKPFLWNYTPIPDILFDVDAIEYFVNNDPGLGNATPYTDFALGEDLMLNIPIDLSVYGSGNHIVCVRGRNTHGNWSLIQNDTVRFCTQDPAQADFETFTFGNQVSFADLSERAWTYEWDFGDGNTSSLSNPLHNYVPGAYTACQIVANDCIPADTICKQVNIAGISEYSPHSSGNIGDVEMHFFGYGFDESTIITLQGPEEIVADSFQIFESAQMAAFFDLRGKQVGTYDVMVSFNGESFSFPNGFTIEEGIFPDMTMNISGRGQLRPNRWQTYDLTLSNNGNVDAEGVPFMLAVPESAEVDFLVEFILTDSTIYDTTTNYTLIDTLAGAPFKGKLYWFFAPIVRANDSQTYSFRMRLSELGNFQMSAWTQPTLYASPLSPFIPPCYDFFIDLALDFTIGDEIDCALEGYDLFIQPVVEAIKGDIKANGLGATKLVGDMTASFINILNECHGIVPVFKVKRIVVNLANLATIYKNGTGKYKNLVCCLQGCPTVDPNDNASRKPPLPIPDVQKNNLRVATSFDPNEKAGPIGFGEGNYITGRSHQNFIIYFENIDTAQAPAQEIRVIDTLDISKFDLSTFSFNKVNFNEQEISIPRNTAQYTTDVDLRPEQNILVRINAKIDKTTGIVCWQMLSIDPETMEFTEDPNLGILFPNISPPEGDGLVSFSVKSFSDLLTDERIENKAEIFFDFNEPIVTNTWLNSIDITAPICSVDVLEDTITNSEIPIRISGSDEGVGIERYNLFVSVNGDPFEAQLFSMPSEFIYNGETGSQYRFYAVAIDSVGNMESKVDVVEAETQVVTSIKDVIEKQKFTILPNPTTGTFIVDWNSATINGIDQLKIYNTQGQCLLVKDVKNLRRVEIDTNLTDGIYIVELIGSAQKFIEKLIINK